MADEAITKRPCTLHVYITPENTIRLDTSFADGEIANTEFDWAFARTLGARLMQAASEAEEEEKFINRKTRDLTREQIKKPGGSNGHGTNSTEGGTDGDG